MSRRGWHPVWRGLVALGSRQRSGVDLSAGSGAGGDPISGFGNVVGSGFADTVTGDGGANALYGEDAIADFDYTAETIDLEGGLGFADSADLADNLESDGAGGSVITFDTGEAIRLIGVDPGNVDVSLFV